MWVTLSMNAWAILGCPSGAQRRAVSEPQENQPAAHQSQMETHEAKIRIPARMGIRLSFPRGRESSGSAMRPEPPPARG